MVEVRQFWNPGDGHPLKTKKALKGEWEHKSPKFWERGLVQDWKHRPPRATHVSNSSSPRGAVLQHPPRCLTRCLTRCVTTCVVTRCVTTCVTTCVVSTTKRVKKNFFRAKHGEKRYYHQDRLIPFLVGVSNLDYFLSLGAGAPISRGLAAFRTSPRVNCRASRGCGWTREVREPQGTHNFFGNVWNRHKR